MDVPELLIVDDEPVNIQVLSAVLKDRYRIRFSVSGQQALTMVEENPPDLILLDIMMPDMSGIELCKILKSRAGSEAIPVLFVTSNQEREIEVDGLAAGGTDFIYKPVRPHLVRTRIANYLELKQAREKLLAQSHAENE